MSPDIISTQYSPGCRHWRQTRNLDFEAVFIRTGAVFLIVIEPLTIGQVENLGCLPEAVRERQRYSAFVIASGTPYVYVFCTNLRGRNRLYKAVLYMQGCKIGWRIERLTIKNAEFKPTS